MNTFRNKLQFFSLLKNNEIENFHFHKIKCINPYDCVYIFLIKYARFKRITELGGTTRVYKSIGRTRAYTY